MKFAAITFAPATFAAALTLAFSLTAAPEFAQAQSSEAALMPVRVERVQQYEDRMPVATDDGRVVPPRTITLIEFEVEACRILVEENFKVTAKTSGDAQRAEITMSDAISDGCAAAAYPQKFTVVSKEFAGDKQIQIANPVLIEKLPPVE